MCYPVSWLGWIPPDHGHEQVEAADHLAEDIEGTQGQGGASLHCKQQDWLKMYSLASPSLKPLPSHKV